MVWPMRSKENKTFVYWLSVRLLLFLNGWDCLRGWGLSDVAWEHRGSEADADCPWVVG